MLRAMLASLLALPLLASAAMFDATVVAVSDGDTITVTVPKPCEAGQSCFKGLNSTHKCNAHPCINFVRRLPAQAFSRA